MCKNPKRAAVSEILKPAHQHATVKVTEITFSLS